MQRMAFWSGMPQHLREEVPRAPVLAGKELLKGNCVIAERLPNARLL